MSEKSRALQEEDEAQASTVHESKTGESCASFSSWSARDFSLISGSSLESDAMGPDSAEAHVEHAVPIRHAGCVRFDRLGQLDLAMEHPPFCVERVDRQQRLGRGDFQGLAGRAP